MARQGKIIDFHVHAFPDDLAKSAMKKLLDEAPEVKAFLDGTVGNLLESMDRCSIEKAVLCCIATKPKQYDSIFRWCKQIQSERIIAFPSIHPYDPKKLDRLEQIKEAGFLGVKMHPFYQLFWMDDEAMIEIYEKLSELGLMLVMHTGYDIAFEHERRADPQQILNVHQEFPDLKLITTHFGSWFIWKDVQKYLIGKPIYMELSFALDYLKKDRARDMLMSHPEDYILFGTDSPWTDQAKTLELLQNLDLPGEKLEKILYSNAARLLGEKC